MAFSTQKDFFHVPFMNETVQYECRRACVKLKSYDSTIDDRSWAMDDSLQSKFLTDLVTCNTPIAGFGLRTTVDGTEGGDHLKLPGMTVGSGLGGPRTIVPPASSVEGAGAKGKDEPLGGDTFLSKGLVGADSIIECANKHLCKLEEVLVQKKSLEKQLEVSNERLKTANLENEKIKSILNEKYDSSHSKDFYNKIQKLASSGKISKGEENELLHIYNKVEDMNKAHEVVQAENAYLKRLLEKLSLRATMDSIKVEPETSTDVAFLQGQVNSLRKEVSMLRKFEDEKLRTQVDNRSRLSDQDAQNLKAIIKERNVLREKCKTFDKLEKKVQELQKKAKEADHMSDSLSSNLDNQTKYIGEMEQEMHRMQNYYEDQLSKMKFNEELLKCQLEEMKEDLIRAKCEAQKVECLQMEIGCLRNELMRRDVALSDYDCQYKQLMIVIDELQGSVIRNLQDTQTQTCTDYMEDLAFFASATLVEIKKEVVKRGALGNMGFGSGLHSVESPEQEIARLQDMIKRLSESNEHLTKNMNMLAEEACADAMNQVREMENEYKKAQTDVAKLKAENDRLSMTAASTLEKLGGRVDTMTKENAKHGQDTANIKKELQDSIDLIKDISDVHIKNQHLSETLNTLNSRDDEKIIDDLRRQLLDEQMKNKKCLQQNENLRNQLVRAGITPMPDGAAGGVGAAAGGPGATAGGPGAAAGGPGAAAGGPGAAAGGPGAAAGGPGAAAGGPGAVAGGPGAAAGGPGAAVGGPGAAAGGPGAAAGGPGAAAGGPGAAAGGPGAAAGGPGAAAGGPGAAAGGPGAAAGGPGAAAGGPGAAAGGPGAAAGGPGAAAGGPGAAAGGPGAAAGGPGAAAGGPDGAAGGPGAAAGGAGAAAGGPDGATGGPGAAAGRPGSASGRPGSVSGRPGSVSGRPGSVSGGPGAAAGGPGAVGGGPGAAAGGPGAVGGGPGAAAGGPGAAAGGPDGAAGGPGAAAGGPDGAAGGPGAAAGGPGAAAGGPGAAAGGPGAAAGGPGAVVGGPGAAAGGPGAAASGPGAAAGGFGAAAGGPGGVGGTDGYGVTVGFVSEGGPGSAGAHDNRSSPGANALAGVGGKGKGQGAASGHDPYQDFIDHSASNMVVNLSAGSNLEKELRAILNAFMQECGFCFCKNSIPKSKFYALCHKILHHGLPNLTFRELVYIHRKVFIASEKIHPGCLLNMILTEQGLKVDGRFKCCNCRNVLCCSNSEEMLKEKVCKLERDIEMAKEYLDNLKVRPQSPRSSRKTYRLDMAEDEDRVVTYRQSKPHSRCSSKQIRTLKARILKCTELMK